MAKEHESRVIVNDQPAAIAAGYLDTAENAIDSLRTYQSDGSILHAQVFESTGLRQSDLMDMTSYGATLLTKIREVNANPNAAAGLIPALSKKPEQLVSDVQLDML